MLTASFSSGLIEKIHGFMGKKKQQKKRNKKKERKEEKKDYESESSSDFSQDESDSDVTESINLLPSEDEFDNKKMTKKTSKKFKKKIKKTPAIKRAIEEKKRKDAENLDRGIHVDVEDSGIRITKTRFINDTEDTEVVEIDPTIKEIRPKNWKIVEREEERKDYETIEDEHMRFSSDSNLLYIDDSITTANRNIIRAALTDNVELAKLCIEENTIISSLMESWSPELKSTALELCISNNSRKVLELLLKSSKEEEAKVRVVDTFGKKLLSKFDTGQVDERAFGTKVRKVEMMRGGRQGNNAFMQDIKRKEEYSCMFQQLNEDELLAVRAAYSCNIEIPTLRVIYEELKEQAFPFFKQIFYHILRTGRRHLAAECLKILKIIGDQETKSQITDEMITILQLEGCKLQEKKEGTMLYYKDGRGTKNLLIKNLDPTHNFEGVNYLHLACINQNTSHLVKELLSNGYDLNMKDKLGATAIFFAAVNPNSDLLEFILDDDSQYLRVYDKKDNTPLIMAIIGRRTDNIHFMLQKVPSAVKDKSILRLTPLSVACRNGSLGSMRTVMSYKGSPPNQAGGWEKMTPL